jgi:4'-phosphopantetheinyl transferase
VAVNQESGIRNQESGIIYWLTQNSDDVPESNDWLSHGERSLLAGMRVPKRRQDWRLGRWTAKLAICGCRAGESHPLSTLEIRAAAEGAPEVFWDNVAATVSISISHSNGRSLCAVGARHFAVGCDLEKIEPREENLILDYFASEEISFIRQARVAEKSLAVNLIWSAKETALKILREGLRRDTRSVFIRPDFGEREGGWNTWTGHCMETGRLFCGWWRSCDGFIYTLASDCLTSAPEPLGVDSGLRALKSWS